MNPKTLLMQVAVRQLLASLLLTALTLLAGKPRATAAEVKITYEVKQPGGVSLGIYDTRGQLVRALQSGKKLTPGKYQVLWDAMDDEHHVCPPGKYQLRGISSRLELEYILVAGNPGKPPYATPDGKGGWNGHWGNPIALAHDGSYLYAQFSGEEVWGSQLKLDEAGAVQWKANLFQGDGNGFQLGVATDGKYVYVAADVGMNHDLLDPHRRAVVWRTKADSGEYALWNNHGLLVGQPYRSGPRPFWELVEGDRTSPPSAFGLEGGPSPRGLAVRNDRLYVALYREDKIEIWDTTAGKRLDEIGNISKPQGLAIDAAGNLFVASGTQILCIHADGKVGPAVAQGLVAPYGVAVDAQGNLFVTDLGSSQQVKKFSPDGRLLWVSGKPGGRPLSGRYLRDAFLFPVGIAVMPSGRIFVSEDAAPRRIVALDPQGKLLQDWVGTLDIGAGCGIGPDDRDPSVVYVNQALGHYCSFANNIFRLNLDFLAKTWRVDAYWMGMGEEGPRHDHLCMPHNRQIASGSSDYQVRHFAGHTYLFSGQHWNHPIWSVEGDTLRPCAAIGQSDRMLPVDLDKGYQLNARGDPLLRNANRAFIWRDVNGDGLASASEVEFFAEPKGLGGHGTWGAYLDRQMNAYLPDSEGTGNVYKLPCLGVDPRGNPIYSWAKAEIVIASKQAALAAVDYARTGDVKRAGQLCVKPVERIQVDGAGNIYGTTEIMGHDKGIGWAAETMDVKVGKWDLKGNRIWRTGIKARGFAKPGQFYTGKGVDGILRGFVFFTDENGQSRVYNEDGLYAGSVPAEDAYRGAAPGPNVVNIEMCGARAVTDPKTDTDYYFAGDGAGLHVWRLKGLKHVERFAVPLELGASAAAPPPTTTPGAPDATRSAAQENSTAVARASGWMICEGCIELGLSNLCAVAFATPEKGTALALGGRTGIIHSEDGGVTWRHAQVDFGTDALVNLFDVTFANGATGWIIGRFNAVAGQDRWKAMLLRSDDAGASWCRLPLPRSLEETNAHRVWFDRRGNGWIMPYSGAVVFRTADAGKSWREFMAPSRQRPRNGGAWYVFDANHLMLGAPGGFLAETRDAGATWNEMDIRAAGLEAQGVAFADSKHGWIVGRGGVVLHTADGGKTWSAQASGVVNHLERVQFVSPLVGYAVAPAPKPSLAGVLLATTNGGQTWSNVSPVGSSLAGLFFLDAKHGWAVGGQGGGIETPMMILRYTQP
jgi:photosystem II stability/assembly factor-like uncharacterized protein/sugar lactone lactonase YvrE